MQNKRIERKKIMEELTRKDILDSAVTILMGKGLKKLTMDTVASGAGIAKGTVYLYYKNKQALLDAVLDYAYLPLQEKLAKIIQADAKMLWILEQCILVCLQHTEENLFLLKQLRSALFATMDQRISDKKSWYWTIARMLGKVLEEAAESGMIRPVNYVKVSALFIDSIDSLMVHRIFSEVEETIEQDVKELLSLYLNGLRV
ncbi:MAG: TetR/AcrR family transcriptional regulator [Desulfobacteraceae bacterium]|nr:TetR/AcrR family transcriptional regulator [Desulfobacteraceae bacterium]